VSGHERWRSYAPHDLSNNRSPRTSELLVEVLFEIHDFSTTDAARVPHGVTEGNRRTLMGALELD